ncbi:MAG TPA: hypothetical protein VG498_03735 [Terriglobales bacterium]|nr:hypothetical protein [Terriglobales bacterium]
MATLIASLSSLLIVACFSLNRAAATVIESTLLANVSALQVVDFEQSVLVAPRSLAHMWAAASATVTLVAVAFRIGNNRALSGEREA